MQSSLNRVAYRPRKGGGGDTRLQLLSLKKSRSLLLLRIRAEWARFDDSTRGLGLKIIRADKKRVRDRRCLLHSRRLINGDAPVLRITGNETINEMKLGLVRERTIKPMERAPYALNTLFILLGNGGRCPITRCRIGHEMTIFDIPIFAVIREIFYRFDTRV